MTVNVINIWLVVYKSLTEAKVNLWFSLFKCGHGCDKFLINYLQKSGQLLRQHNKRKQEDYIFLLFATLHSTSSRKKEDREEDLQKSGSEYDTALIQFKSLAKAIVNHW